MIRAKVLYLVSVFPKLCKKKHFKDKCPSVQREWEEFIKNKEKWKRMLRDPALCMQYHAIAFSPLLSQCVNAFIKTKRWAVPSYFNDAPGTMICSEHVTLTHTENAMLAGSLMTIKHGIEFSLLVSLLTALCVKPHQLNVAWLISSFLSCPRIDTLYLSPQPKGRINKSDIKSDRPA